MAMSDAAAFRESARAAAATRRVTFSNAPPEIFEIPRRLNPLPARLGAVKIPKVGTRRQLTREEIAALTGR